MRRNSGKTEQRCTRQITSMTFTCQAPASKQPSMVRDSLSSPRNCRCTMPCEPMKAMYPQARVPSTKAISVQSLYLCGFRFCFSTGMKNAWIAKACPSAAARSMPSPWKSRSFSWSWSESSLPTAHVMKKRQVTMLTMPQAMSVAPKSLNFITKTIASRAKALMIGLSGVYSLLQASPSHCITMSSQQRIKMTIIVEKMQNSQNILTFLLFQKCCSIATSISVASPVCKTHKQHEQQLMNPVTNSTMRVSSHPDSKAMTGRIRIKPPIIPLTRAITVIGPERPGSSSSLITTFKLSDSYYKKICDSKYYQKRNPIKNNCI